MAIDLHEQVQSRSVTYGAGNATQSRIYKVTGATSSEEALDAVIDGAPTSVVVRDVLCNAPRRFDVKPTNAPTDAVVSIYLVKVDYAVAASQLDDQDGGDTQPRQPGDPPRLRVDFSSITDFKFEDPNQDTYIDTTGIAIAASPFVNNFKPINQQDPKLPPEGQEINSPIANFSFEFVMNGAKVTNEWLKARMDQIWTLNASEFRSLPAKSVALTGAQISSRSDGHWDVTYNFEYRPNRPSVTLGQEENEILVPATTGWRYVWGEYTKWQERKVDNTVGAAANGDDTRTWRELQRVHVANLYETSDFSLLELPF